MASLRNLKKDIKYISTEIFTQCFILVDLFPKCDIDKVNEILADTILMEKEFIANANNCPEKKNLVLVKRHYKALANDLMAKSYDLMERVAQIDKRE
jgi:hypothetical protein